MNRKERRALAKQAPKAIRKQVEQALKEAPELEPKPSLLEESGFVIPKMLWTPNQA